jgi:hypothetical protein
LNCTVCCNRIYVNQIWTDDDSGRYPYGIAKGEIWEGPSSHRSFQANGPLPDGTLESPVTGTEGAMHTVQKLSGKNTEDIVAYSNIMLIISFFHIHTFRMKRNVW